MTTFLASYTNGIDKKGRVSVPASFRAELANQSRQVIVVFASPDEPFLYAWGYDDFLKFAEGIKKLPPMSKERQRLGRSILAAARPLPIDGDGRIVVPEQFVGKARLESKAMFAGQGDYFTMWNPDVYEETLGDDLPYYEQDLEALTAWGEE